MQTQDPGLENEDQRIISPDDPINVCMVARRMGMTPRKLRELFAAYRCRPTLGNLLFISFCSNVEMVADIGGIE